MENNDAICKKCECGKVISDEDYSYNNAKFDDGVKFCMYDFACTGCGREIEFSDYGHCDNPFDAINLIAERLS